MTDNKTSSGQTRKGSLSSTAPASLNARIGYVGKILRVNLSEKTIKAEPIDDEICRLYLGGSGFISYYLWKELKPGIDALSPENKIIFATGPVTGTALMGSGRHSVGAKSPLTGGIALSQVGEFWGTEIKRAGFDIVIIEGKADKPVYLWINDNDVSIHDASHLWGKPTKETQQTIREESGDEKTRVSLIGPGGENLVRFACIMSGLYDAAGRGGLGAVMGSKNLKAIAVRGTGKIPLANPDKLGEIRTRLASYIERIPILKGWHEAGTGFDMEDGVMRGDVPIRNWRDGSFPGVKNINAVMLRDTIGIGMEGCFACPLRCKKKVRFDTPFSVDPDYGGPEYEALASLGSNCGIDDLKSIVKANELCNAYSIDVISAGGVIAFAMECFERGLLTKKQTDGIELKFGNAEGMLACIEKIAWRDGFGGLLAEGTARVAQTIGNGAEDFAVHVKGLDPGQHEPRLMPSMGLGFMVNPHGADHCCNVHDDRFVYKAGLKSFHSLGFHQPLPAEDIGPGKVALFKAEYLRQVLLDCLSLCHLSSVMVDLQTIVDIMSAVADWDTGVMEQLRIAERVMTVARLFNIREGFTDTDDTLPQRFFEPKTSGALSHRSLDKNKMEKAKKYYYSLMGWDSKGIPLPEKVEELYIQE